MAVISLSAQKKTDFNIDIPSQKISDSKYDGLHYIESRWEPENLGVVFINNFTGYDRVTLPVPFEYQLDSLVKSVTGPRNVSKKIALQMRNILFGIGFGKHEDREICNLRMTLYEMTDDNTFYFLNTLDTLIVTPRKQIREKTGNAITSFIIDNLPYTAYEDEEAMSLEMVQNIDKYEKNNIPFYLDEQIPDGVYYTYKSLMMLTPDAVVPVEIEKDKEEGKLKAVKMADLEKPGKTKKLKGKEAYAVVEDGIPYISYNGNFHQAYFEEGNWVVNIVRKVAGSGFSLGIGIGVGGNNAAGGMGVGIPIGGKKETISLYIDHLNGDFY